MKHTLRCTECGEEFDFDSHEHICKNQSPAVEKVGETTESNLPSRTPCSPSDDSINWKIQNLINEYCYCEDMHENNSGFGFVECCKYCHIGAVAQKEIKEARRNMVQDVIVWIDECMTDFLSPERIEYMKKGIKALASKDEEAGK